MSVIVVVRVKADPADVKKVFADRGADLIAISDDAKSQGCTHHRFVAGDGEVLVIDEWGTAESFQKFFESNTAIPALLQAANVQGPPEVQVYEPMETPDQF